MAEASTGNKLAIGVGITLALVGVGVGLYFVLRPKKPATDAAAAAERAKILAKQSAPVTLADVKAQNPSASNADALKILAGILASKKGGGSSKGTSSKGTGSKGTGSKGGGTNTSSKGTGSNQYPIDSKTGYAMTSEEYNKFLDDIYYGDGQYPIDSETGYPMTSYEYNTFLDDIYYGDTSGSSNDYYNS
jgi:hypothetical protein